MADDSIATTAEAPATSTGTGTQLFLGLLWLGTTMWVAHATLTGAGSPAGGALGSAVAALPDVVAATVVTSATIASAASSRFASSGRRLLVGLGLGIVFGALAAAALRFGYGSTPSITVLAVTVGVASVLGGAAAMLPNSVLEAALWGVTWVFFAGVIFGVLQPQILTMLGGGAAASTAAQVAALSRFTLGQSVVTGLIGGVYAARSLRGERPARGWFGVAGALTGLALLASEALTRLGGHSLVTLVNGDAQGVSTLSDAGRLRHAVIVTVVGALVGLLMAGPRPATED